MMNAFGISAALSTAAYILLWTVLFLTNGEGGRNDRQGGKNRR